MEKDDILNIIKNQFRTVVISAGNDQGLTVSSVVNLIIDNEKIVFFIAKGQELFKCFEKNDKITLAGYSGNPLSMQTIVMSGKIREIAQDLCKELIKKDITLMQFYDNSKALNMLHGYEIYEYRGDYMDSHQGSIQRDFFSSHLPILAKVYQVTGQCIYCKACYRVCPQKCIDITKKPAKINVNHCLQCGKCADICPRKAIIKADIQPYHD